MNKDEWRKQLAALPFSETTKMLEKLRQRELAIAPVREALARTRSEQKQKRSK